MRVTKGTSSSESRSGNRIRLCLLIAFADLVTRALSLLREADGYSGKCKHQELYVSIQSSLFALPSSSPVSPRTPRRGNSGREVLWTIGPEPGSMIVGPSPVELLEEKCSAFTARKYLPVSTNCKARAPDLPRSPTIKVSPHTSDIAKVTQSFVKVSASSRDSSFKGQQLY